MPNLIIEIPNCPKCNSPACGTIETIPACAEFEHLSDGTVAYTGNTEPLWDQQETSRDSDGRAEMTCEHHHHWFSKMTES
jgi:hypothetical protein